MAAMQKPEVDAVVARPAKTTRERLLEVAMELFYRDGIRAVGIDTIIARSGVAKMSLYRNFPSKDDLVVAFLAARDEVYWAWWDHVMARHKDDPRQQVSELFASLARRIADPRYRGCPFINTTSEFPDPSHPARAICTANKRRLRAGLLDLATRLGAAHPAMLAGQLYLLMEGAYAAAPSLRGDDLAANLQAAADTLVTAQLAASGRG
jgi:AcrR family transcriptional regulator